MRKKWVVCMIACLTILLTGCNGNTAKETARNDTDKRISSTAGNTETEKADDTTSVVPETEQPVSSEATTEPSQQEKSDVSSTAGSKTETAKSYESVQVTKKPDSTQEQKQPQQSKPETPKVTEEVKPTKPKPTEEPKQSFDVNPYVSYARQLLLGTDENRIDEVLQIVSLTNTGKKKAGQFSLGMKQRLGIAMALLGEPELLILDEPTNGLDPIGIEELRELIRSFPEQGITVILSSHILSEVQLLADKVGIISGGILGYEGALKQGDNLEDLFMNVVRKNQKAGEIHG